MNESIQVRKGKAKLPGAQQRRQPSALEVNMLVLMFVFCVLL